jgi:uncharacterized Tic20 family protein
MNDPLENSTPDPGPLPPPAPAPAPEAPSDGLPSAEEKQWAMFAHLSALVGGLLTSAVGGWGVFLGPLVIWLMKKDTMAFVNDQGKEALNYNITVAIACFALLLLSIVTLGVGLLIAVPLWIVIGIAWLVLTIIASIKASNGEYYRYPMTLRLVK